MSDFIEELWSSFEEESDEHLSSMRPLLEKALTCFDPDDVVTLYRDMQSINNPSRAMEMHGIEEIAHLSEILIGAARQGETSWSLI